MNILSLINIISGMIYLFLGLYVLSINYKSKMNRFFSIICFDLFLFSFLSYFVCTLKIKEDAVFYCRFSIIFVFIFAVMHFHFYLILTNKYKLKKNLLLVLYLPALILIIQDFIGTPIISDIKKINGFWTFKPDYDSFWFYIFSVYLTICFTGNVSLFINWFKTAVSNKEKRQAFVIGISFVVFLFISISDAIILPIFDSYNSIGITPILFIIYITGIYIAIIKYKFLSVTPELVSKLILTNINEAVIFFNKKLDIVFLNERMKKIIKGEQFPGICFKNHINNYDQVIEAIKKMILKNDNELSCRISLEINSDIAVILESKFTVIKDKFNDLLGVVLIGYETKKIKHLKTYYKITNREAEVIQYVMNGDTNREIGVELGITERTVKMHISSIYNKLGVENKAQLFAFLKYFNLLPEQSAERILVS